MGHAVQLVPVLGDQYAIFYLVAFQLGMGMAADDEVEPGKLFRHPDIVGIAQMRQEDGDIPFLAEGLVLGNHLFGRLEGDALEIVGMGAGNAFRTELDATDDTYLQAFYVKHLMGYQFDS